MKKVEKISEVEKENLEELKKYHWIEIKDYASTQTLEDYVHRILANYGKVDGIEINFG